MGGWFLGPGATANGEPGASGGLQRLAHGERGGTEGAG